MTPREVVDGGANVRPTVRRLRCGLWEAIIDLGGALGRIEGRGDTDDAARADLAAQLDGLERMLGTADDDE